MKVACEWTGGLQFKGATNDHQVLMDTLPPLGNNTAASPKNLLLMAACGCTGMDVVALLKKKKQDFEALSIFADATVSETTPAVFTKLHLTYEFEGEVGPEAALDAIRLSMTKYCSINAMLSKSMPITYTVEINGTEVGKGSADFHHT